MRTVYLERFDINKHGNLLWQYYNDIAYSEFFRKTPKGLTEAELVQAETLMKTILFCVIYESKVIGILSFSDLCPFSLSCHIGIMLNSEYWDKRHKSGLKFSLIALLLLGELMFEQGNVNKASMRILKDREDIITTYNKIGIPKEGEFKQSAYCYGELKDEVEYAFFKSMWPKSKQLLGDI